MKNLLVIMLVSLLAIMVSGQSYAQPGNDRSDFGDFVQRSRGEDVRIQNDLLPSPSNEEQTSISRREASDRARNAYPGRVLSVKPEGRRWRVRMDEEGTVFDVFVDSENGEVNRPSD